MIAIFEPASDSLTLPYSPKNVECSNESSNAAMKVTNDEKGIFLFYSHDINKKIQ